MSGARSRGGKAGIATMLGLAAGVPVALGSHALPQQQLDTGIYHGHAKGAAVNRATDTSEGEGGFRLKRRTGGGYVIVASRSPYGITSPSDPRDPSPKACNQFNATLPVDRIRVRAGHFRWEGYARIGYVRPGGTPPRVHVIFKGRWVERNKLVGTTRFRRGSCDDTRSWRMHTPPGSH